MSLTGAEVKARLETKLPFEELLHLWQEHHSQGRQEDVEICRLLGEQFIKQGELVLGLDVISAGLQIDPRHVRLRQLQALGLAGTGATAAAAKILKNLDADQVQEETLGLLGRVHKDLWRYTGDRTYLRSASEIYLKAFELARNSPTIHLDGALYTGINAATTLFLLDEVEVSRKLARDICRYCEAKLKSGPDYWAEATLGEAALLQNNIEAAADRYQRAACEARGNWRDLASMRRQAREILERSLGRSERSRLDACFGVGPVVVFSGHMIDTEQRLRSRAERFPARNIPQVTDALRQTLSRLRPCGAYSSAACGADLIFLNTVREMSLDCPVCVVLPFSEGQFVETSVAVGGLDWESQFQRTMNWVRTIGRVEKASEHPLVEMSASFDYANIIIQGLATIQARSLDTDLVGVAVWDGESADGSGGTADAISRWVHAGVQVEIIHPDGNVLRDYSIPAPIELAGATRIMALLFADVEHYTSLTEQQIPIFRDEFLTLIADVAAQTEAADLKNTWGDALFFVFQDVRKAASFALAMQEAIEGTDWTKVGLPSDLGLRVGLHAGPVYECTNPVTGRKDYLGSHISRAARIEPKTMRGQIYCSREFVALAYAMGVQDFTFEYVGRIELPKNSGTIPAYSVRRRIS